MYAKQVTYPITLVLLLLCNWRKVGWFEKKGQWYVSIYRHLLSVDLEHVEFYVFYNNDGSDGTGI